MAAESPLLCTDNPRRGALQRYERRKGWLPLRSEQAKRQVAGATPKRLPEKSNGLERVKESNEEKQSNYKVSIGLGRCRKAQNRGHCSTAGQERKMAEESRGDSSGDYDPHYRVN